jgi:hypothetical protein
LLLRPESQGAHLFYSLSFSPALSSSYPVLKA